MEQGNIDVTFGTLGGGMSYQTKQAVMMRYQDFVQALEASGQSVIESALLESVRAAAHQLLEEYAPYKYEDMPAYMRDFYMKVKRVSISIDVLNVQAGLVTCGMPGCTNKADIPTSLGNLHFCESCYQNRLGKTCGE